MTAKNHEKRQLGPARARFRRIVRHVVRVKFVLDLFTLYILIRIVICTLNPANFPLSEWLTDFWLWVLRIFVGGREIIRWTGDHARDRYYFRWATHGEIYLILFWFALIFVEVCESYLGCSYIEIDLLFKIAINVTVLFGISAISKFARDKEFPDLIEAISKLVKK